MKHPLFGLKVKDDQGKCYTFIEFISGTQEECWVQAVMVDDKGKVKTMNADGIEFELNTLTDKLEDELL